MSKSTRLFVWGLVAALCAAGGTWLAAQAEDDDRPPIIVRSGSLIFQNGVSTKRGTPWSQDSVLGEWKPQDDNYKGISGYAVTFENVYAPSTCAASTLTGDEVNIEYTTGNGTILKTRLKRRRSHLLGLFGKGEPKLDPLGNQLTPPVSPAGEPMVMLTDATRGYISKVSVGTTECAFPAPPAAPDPSRENFHVRIQPKAEKK